MKRSQEFKILATIDVGGAIVAVATLFAVLKILENFMSNANSMKATSVSGIIGIAVGMVLFASAIRILGAMDMLSCLQGVLALGIIMGELKYFLNGLEGVKAGSILSASVSMTVMGAAMLILTAAIAIIGALPLANVVQGLVVIGALMAVFALFAKAVSSINIGAILSASVAMAIMATAMIPLTAALAIISFLPNKLGSVTALLGTLAGVAAILALLGNFGGGALNMAAASTSILVVSAAILVLAGALVAISAINNPIATILTLLGALAVVFIALGVAALVLTPVMPAMLALAGVLVLVGVGCLAAGAGITLLSTGLIAFAAAIVANVDMIVTAFTMIVTGVGTVLLALGGVVVSVLSQLIPSLVEAGLQMIMALLSSFESHVGDIGMIALMMTSTDTVTEHPLAYVTIPAGSTSIESRNISFVVGTSECPFVAGVVQSVSIDALVQNWKDEFAHLIDNSSNEFDILMRNFENLVNESGDDFDDLMQNCEKKYDQAISNSNAQFGDVLDRFDTLYEKLITQTEQAASKTIIDGSVTYEKLAHDAVRMIFRNVEVKTADFYIDPSNTSIRYPYRASIPLIGVDSTMYPDVGFGDAVIGFAPFAESYGEVDAYNGGIYIYSKSIPSENITIPIVFCWR